MITGRADTTMGDRGSGEVTFAIALVVIMGVLALVMAGGRVSLMAQRITGVAGVAARDASLARSASDAESVAQTSARAALSGTGLRCENLQVNVDTSGFAAPPEAMPVVRVQVTCTVRLSDLAGTLLPGSRTLTDQAVSPLDPARDNR